VERWSACKNHLDNLAPGDILPRLVGVQPQVEALRIERGFGPKDIRRQETPACLDMVKYDLYLGDTASTANSPVITSTTASLNYS
jgi:hypothetical protein